MAPNLLGNSSSLFQSTSGEPVQIISTKDDLKKSYQPYQSPRQAQRKGPYYRWKIVWRNVFIFLLLHSLAVYALFLLLTGRIMLKTFLFNVLYASFSAVGVTGGAHRLWAHRTYKAKTPFRILLMLWHTAALQNDIHEWVRDHRVHHKFTDTDADPHNASRGFFFSHIGWLMLKKHKDVITKGKTIDMSDIEADPVVMWQKRHYVTLVTLFTFLLPAYIPWYFWRENYIISMYVTIFRYTLSLNFTWLVNSAAHIWGTKPYDRTINPTENRFVSIVGFGEGWHNYHHTFPWDYKAAELGNYRMNFTTAMLDFMSYLGQAYDLKTASADMVRKRVSRTGDGSWKNGPGEPTEQPVADTGHSHHLDDCVWGWGDKDMLEEEIRDVRLYNNLKED